MPVITHEAWENFYSSCPDSHLLQSASWGELKSHFGWRVRWVRQGNAGAQILFRKLPLGLSIAYIPKGPIGQDWGDLWSQLDTLCRKERAIFLKVEPDVASPVSAVWIQEQLPGFISSRHTVQPPRTLMVNLIGGEEAVLGRMKQKTRYNIRLAEKKSVSVRRFDNVEVFTQLMQETGQRDAFGVHNQSYYRAAYRFFALQNESAMFLAEYQSQPLAAVMAFRKGKRAWYFYGASSNAERNRMPAYLVQWEAMRWAIQSGCTEYDLWGVPDAEEGELEANFASRSEGLWGVYRFKRGFGGQLVRSIGAWDKVYSLPLYRFYQLWLRRRGMAE